MRTGKSRTSAKTESFRHLIQLTFSAWSVGPLRWILRNAHQGGILVLPREKTPRSGQRKFIYIYAGTVQERTANDTHCMQRTEKVIPHYHSNPNESGRSMMCSELYAAAVTRSSVANKYSWAERVLVTAGKTSSKATVSNGQDCQIYQSKMQKQAEVG